MQNTAKSTRRPAVAGSFYPASPMELTRQLDELLIEAPRVPIRPQAIVVPHAGYRYSGPIAASAYGLLPSLLPKPSRVVLLGPAHTVDLRALALPGCDAMATPLGDVALDREGVRLAEGLPQVVTSADAHETEHSLEVQLPFLQRTLGDFQLVPLVVGRASASEVEAVLEALWSGPQTLVVISTDLSHYLPYELARVLDRETAERVLAFDGAHLDGNRACGVHPLTGFLAWAKKRRLQSRLLDLRNSGDTAGDRARVVGYASFAFY